MKRGFGTAGSEAKLESGSLGFAASKKKIAKKAPKKKAAGGVPSNAWEAGRLILTRQAAALLEHDSTNGNRVRGALQKVGKSTLTVAQAKLRLPAAKFKDLRADYAVVSDLAVAYGSKYTL